MISLFKLHLLLLHILLITYQCKEKKENGIPGTTMHYKDRHQQFNIEINPGTEQ